jgi:hypothetical protein
LTNTPVIAQGKCLLPSFFSAFTLLTVRLAFPLSPLHDLQARLRSLSLSTPLTSPVRSFHPILLFLLLNFLTQPRSLLSRSPSLPDLVPDFTLHPRKVPVKGGGWERGRTPAHHRVCPLFLIFYAGS